MDVHEPGLVHHPAAELERCPERNRLELDRRVHNPNVSRLAVHDLACGEKTGSGRFNWEGF
jgi:hypothetical protein